MRNILYAAVLSIVMLPGVVGADACDYDRVTTCGDVSAGDRRVFDCLKGRQDKVKKDCASSLVRADTLLQSAISGCRNDVQRWCAQYTGDRRIDVIDCLKRHRDLVSEDCRSKVRQFRAYAFDVES